MLSSQRLSVWAQFFCACLPPCLRMFTLAEIITPNFQIINFKPVDI